jgi:hypothetical protein
MAGNEFRAVQSDGARWIPENTSTPFLILQKSRDWIFIAIGLRKDNPNPTLPLNTRSFTIIV